MWYLVTPQGVVSHWSRTTETGMRGSEILKDRLIWVQTYKKQNKTKQNQNKTKH